MINIKSGIVCLDLDETLFHTKNNKVHFRPKLGEFLSYLNRHFYLVVYTAAVKQYADSILNKIDVKNENNEIVKAKDIFILKLYRSAVTDDGKDLKVVIKRLIDDINKKKRDATVLKMKGKPVPKFITVPKEFLYKKFKNKKVYNLDHIIIIDNLVHNFLDEQFFNGIPIKDYFKNKKDRNLVVIMKFIQLYLNYNNKQGKITSFKKFLYNNLYKINDSLKIEYHKCEI